MFEKTKGVKLYINNFTNNIKEYVIKREIIKESPFLYMNMKYN